MPGPLIPFERKSEKVIPRRKFVRRMGLALGLWAALMFGGLVTGMIGYSLTEGMGFADSFVNAAMILSGMGPVDQVQTTAGKMFAGFVLAPIAHRVLHRFHVETKRGDE